jgi:uncharacterized membrane protein YjjB (DUF3815 family)
MSYWRYTFRGPFMHNAAVALMVAIVAMLAFYIMGEPHHCVTVFGAWLSIFCIGMAGNYYNYKRYKRFQREVNKRLRSRFN